MTMATTSELAHLIDLNLRAARSEIMDLPMYDSDWETEPMHNRITLLYEWEDMIDRIEWLSRQYRDGDMSDDQAQRYREMIDALRESVPTLKRLDWPIPPVAVAESV